MRSERQRFIDACLVAAFGHCPNQPSKYLAVLAATFWDQREAERLEHEAANPELVKPKLRKTKGQPAEGQRDRKVG